MPPSNDNKQQSKSHHDDTGHRVQQAIAATAHLDNEVGVLKTDVNNMRSEVADVKTQLRDVSGGVNTLLQRGSGWEATKGMIPQSTVMWGVGILISLVGTGLIMLNLSSERVQKDIDVVGARLKNYGAEVDEARDQSLVNQTRAEERYNNQLAWNSRSDDWNRRQTDRQVNFFGEFEEVRREMATKASISALQDVDTNQQAQISAVREMISAYKSDLEHLEAFREVAMADLVANSAIHGQLEARVKQAEEELDKRWPQLISATTKLGQLEPLIKGLGPTLPTGNEQRLDIMEKLIESIDKDGSRGTNLRLKNQQ